MKRFVKFYYNKSFYKTIRPKYSDSTIFFSNSAIYEQMMEIGSKWANEQHVFDNIWTGEEEISLQSLMHYRWRVGGSIFDRFQTLSQSKLDRKLSSFITQMWKLSFKWHLLALKKCLFCSKMVLLHSVLKSDWSKIMNQLKFKKILCIQIVWIL